MTTVFNILVTYRTALLSGLAVTLQLCLIIWSTGIIAGSLLGASGSKWWTIGAVSRVCTFVLAGIPVLVFLFWVHYPLQTLIGVTIDPFYAAAAALSVINIFAVADVVRNVLNDFPAQYIVAARVCGLSPAQTLLYIQLPIVFRQVLPGLLVTQVNMLQATLFASLISVDEIFRVAQRINAVIYKPVEIYTALALLFLVVCLPLNGLALWMKAR